jgi:hypothetical protein
MPYSWFESADEIAGVVFQSFEFAAAFSALEFANLDTP